jgi:hypothetical protein
MENENIQPQETAQEGGFTFVSEQEVAQAMAQPQPEPTPEPEPQAEVQPEPQQQVEVEQPTQEAAPEQEEYSDSQVEEAVFSFLSERLGREVTSLDDLSQQQSQPELDERIAVIADFVSKTGRDPMDWFKYQSVNPSEMDDMTAIATHMRTQYPDLSDKEINVLMKNKYTVDADLHDESEVQMGQIQMKLDAKAARDAISEMRDGYQMPVSQSEGEEPLINEEWISNMTSIVKDLEGLQFDLGEGNDFKFGFQENYKKSLIDKNARLDEYFDPYVDDKGNWDYEMLSSHRALIDNIDTIAKEIYKKGLGDGQRNLVTKAANISSTQPNSQGAQTTENSLTQQLKDAMMGNSTLTFKI